MLHWSLNFRWSRGYIYNSSYYHNQIGSINLSHCCHIFRGCVPDVIIPSYAVCFIYIPGKLGFLSVIAVQSYDVCKGWSTLWPDGRIRLFACHATSLSSSCRAIWKYWTSKMLVRYILFEYVSKIKSILSIIFPVIYGAMCIQLTHLSYYDYENTCTLYYCHHQIGSMTHLPLFGVRSWNNGARCISFYILTITLCHGSSTTRTNESYHHMYQSISQLSWSRPRVAPMYHYKQLSFP